MWKLPCKLILLFALAACGKQELDIAAADDLNILYNDSGKRIFAVKERWFEETQCSDLEQWAKKNTPQEPDYQYYFVIYHDDITFKGNPYLKSEYDILTNDYNICMMRGDEKKCYYCKNEVQD